jgi:flagellar motor protein MotB
MVTFSDTTGLLVCFFVMLIGFSATEKEDRSRAPGMLSGYPGITNTERIGDDSLLPPQDFVGGQVQLSGYSSIPDYDPLSYVREGFELRVRATVVANALNHQLTKNGFEIRILAGQLFERDSVVVSARGNEVLTVIANACRHLPHQMRVKAYADDLFIPNESAGSAEELAFMRAAAVCERLRTACSIPAAQLATALDLMEEASLPAVEREQVVITILRPEAKRPS